MTSGKTLLLIALVASGLARSDEGGVYTVHDTNADGYLDRTEYEQYLQKRPIRPDYRHLWEFEKVDSDGDGRISNLEMVDALQKEMAQRQQLKKQAR